MGQIMIREQMDNAIWYQIRIMDILEKNWEIHFAPFQISTDDDGTLISGEVHDQAELFGILLKIRDLGLRLVSVNQITRL
jgi:hypothetical protein